MLKFGPSMIMRGQTATPEAFVALAQLAEQLGYDSLWCSDHYFFPQYKTTRYPRRPDGQLPQTWTERYWEVFSVLGHLAAVTRRIALGSSVVVFPMRHPVDTAKHVACLDQLSGGRVIFGVGVGWNRPEFDALGWPFNQRGARTDEGLALCRALWTEPYPTFRGRFHQFEEAAFAPKPLQQPHPPIWIGGTTPAALKRVARFGNGWHPIDIPPEVFATKKQELARLMEQQGRRMEELTLAPKLHFTFQDHPPAPGQALTQGRPADIRDALLRYEDLGASHFVMDFTPETPEQARVMLTRFAEEVRPKL